MAIENTPGLVTYEAYLALPEDMRCELIDGVLYMTPAPQWRHQRLQARLIGALESFVRQHRLGIALGAPFDVVLRQADPALVVQPDALFVARERAALVREAGAFGAPDLVVEVVSPSNPRHDTVKKRHLYAAHGVREYWVVLNDLDQVEVLRQAEGGGFGRPIVLEPGDDLTTPLLPGFALPLAELFEPEDLGG